MNLLAELRADAKSPRLLPALIVGAAFGFILVVQAVSVSAVLFSGPMAPLAMRGAGLPLFGALALCLTIALISAYRGVVSTVQEAPLAVMASIAAAAAASMAGASSETQFATVAVILILATVVSGACVLLIGQIRIANVFRFVPYPVVGGYLAGAGWILVLVSLSIMSGVEPTWEDLPRFLEPVTFWKWLPGVFFAVMLRFVLARWSHFLVMPVSIIAAAALYHAGLALFGISGEDARASGLLFESIGEHRLWPAFHVGDLVHVDWRVVFQQLLNVLVVSPVIVISLTMDLKGIQVGSRVDLDLNREFRAAGLANLISALGGGGPPGNHTVSLSLPTRVFGAYSRLTGIAAALLLAAILFGGEAMLEWFPVPLMGGLFFLIGLELMLDWLIGGRLNRLSADYGIVVLVFLTVAIFGFLHGVAIGLLFAAFILAIKLGQVDVIRSVYTLREGRSRRRRPVSHQAILLDHTDRTRVFHLQGYVFFGSAQELVDRLKGPLLEKPAPLCMLLDCTGVTGFDISALDALGGFVIDADSIGTSVVIVAPDNRSQADLRRELARGKRGDMFWEKDLDHGLERCEEIVLAVSSNGAAVGSEGLRARMIDDTLRHLDELVFFEELIERLRPWLEARDYAAGETVVAEGKKHDGMFLIVEGQVSVFAQDGSRLRQHGPGDVLSPQAAVRDHQASIRAIAGRGCRVMVLTPVARRVLENDDVGLTVELDRYVISSLAP